MIPRLDTGIESLSRRERARGHRGLLLFSGILLAAAALAGCSRDRAAWTERRGPPPAVPGDAGAPDILVVLVDALRPDHLGCYGYPPPTSPSLDRWAGGAALFTRAYTQATHTRMSIASLFTGARPTVHRIREVDLPSDEHPKGTGSTTDALSGRLTTLAESLGAVGYETWAFSANPHVSTELGFDQGFTGFWETTSRRGSEMIDRFLDAWRRRPASGAPPSGAGRPAPLFAYLHLMSVHNPYDPPRAYASVFPAPEGGRSSTRTAPRPT